MARRNENRIKIAKYIEQHPEQSYKEIAKLCSCSVGNINDIVRKFHIVRQPLAQAPAEEN